MVDGWSSTVRRGKEWCAVTLIVVAPNGRSFQLDGLSKAQVEVLIELVGALVDSRYRITARWEPRR